MATATDQLPSGWAAEWLVLLLTFICKKEVALILFQGPKSSEIPLRRSAPFQIFEKSSLTDLLFHRNRDWSYAMGTTYPWTS